MPSPSRSPRAGRRSLRGAATFRLRITMILVTMVVSLFAARLVQLQGVDPQAYAARATAEGVVTATLPAKRGEIVDRNGTALAESDAGKMIVADPTRTKAHAAEIATYLAGKLDLDYFTLLSALSKSGTRFVYVARRVPATTATSLVAALTKRGYEGLATRSDPLRSYPGDDVAANIVGFTNDKGQGANGLELSFNNVLGGRDGHESYEVGDGNRIPLGENDTVEPVDGKTLHLTIDRDVQWYAQRLLCDRVQEAHAKSGSLVAMDTQTGEILALADCPTFDANAPGASAKSTWGSSALATPYEPGSVEKTLTASALINEGLASPRTKIVVPPVLPVMDRVIHDDNDHGTEHLTLTGVIAQSSNIGITRASATIPHQKLYDYLHSFGLGSAVNLGLQGQNPGILPAASTWTQLTQATIAFGQGVSVNAVQMAAAVNTIANKGVYVSPSLIEGKATTVTGQTVGTDTTTRHRVITAETAGKVSRMMEMVTTSNAGTAPGAKIVGYRTAGKTGTAQEVGPKCKCYDYYDVSFAGFAPADQPRFTVYVVIRDPRDGATGGGTAAPVFKGLLTYLLQKYAVPPTTTKPADLPVTW